jgi:hypothetical protein
VDLHIEILMGVSENVVDSLYNSAKNKPDRKKKEKKGVSPSFSRPTGSASYTELERRSSRTSRPRSGELVSSPPQPNSLMAVFFRAIAIRVCLANFSSSLFTNLDVFFD